MKRRDILKLSMQLGVGLAGGAFVVGRTSLAIAGEPSLIGDEVPSEPSFIGTLFYSLVVINQRLSPIETVEQERAVVSTKVALPQDVSLKNIRIAGVPAQLLGTPGARKNRMLLYIHGGGWALSLQDQDRVSATLLSRETGAYVLLPQYRLAPEHPFPAGLDDCVTAYRWLRSQGIAGAQIVLIGGSAGGNLALALALALREQKEELPAAIVTMSAPTDLAMTGEAFKTKAGVDPVLGGDLAKNSYRAYTQDNKKLLKNPLVSPLYADMHGMPPTLLQVGTQEVLLTDSTRMAQRMRNAGVDVTLEVWPGMFHGWNFLGDFLPESRLAIKHIVKYLRHYFA